MRHIAFIGCLVLFTAACGGEVTPPNAANSPAAPTATAGPKDAQSAKCVPIEYARTLNGRELAEATQRNGKTCTKAKASIGAALSELTNNTDETCQKALSSESVQCVEPYSGPAGGWGVWDASTSKKVADCSCVEWKTP